jgi:hypothetical protein
MRAVFIGTVLLLNACRPLTSSGPQHRVPELTDQEMLGGTLSVEARFSTGNGCVAAPLGDAYFFGPPIPEHDLSSDFTFRCTLDSSMCRIPYLVLSGYPLHVTIKPLPGVKLVEWGGDCRHAGDALECDITITRPTTISATFCNALY